MDTKKIKSILINSLSIEDIYVNGNNDYMEIIAISDIFCGMSDVKKQQMIYSPLMKYFTNKNIHSVSIETYTKKEWKKKKKKKKNKN
ncbi:Acid stress protein IbaG [Buchnera aphidicola (Tetraneura ulmi)]|uniref:BolA family protein n=1 Tax=Buchnera aphidicola TaxID=9 RepID=UPI003464D558